MHDETARGDVNDPVFDDSGAGVEFGLGRQIEGERGVGNLDHQANIFRFRIVLEVARGPGEDNEVGLGFIRRIAFRSDIDGRFGVDKLFPESPRQSGLHGGGAGKQRT